MIGCPVRSGVANGFRAGALSWVGRGIDTSNVEPAPGLLSSVMRPPIRLTMRSLILNPNPVPP